ncbi:MAG: N-acetyltransferase [Acholeplasmataceae bacterium]|nr:N-acetyltransferase [Acholeplasmataceae bacterium]
MISKTSKNDNMEQIAHLIYQTDAFLFPFIFGKREKDIQMFAALVAKENNPFSYQNIDVEEDETIRGLIITQKPHDQSNPASDFYAVYPIWKLFRFAVRQFFLFPVFRHNIKAGIYIQNLVVDKKHRGQGVGTKMLLHAMDSSRKAGIEKMYLDVSIKNERAINLYERHGFKIVKQKKAWGLFPITYWMEKDLKED